VVAVEQEQRVRAVAVLVVIALARVWSLTSTPTTLSPWALVVLVLQLTGLQVHRVEVPHFWRPPQQAVERAGTTRGLPVEPDLLAVRAVVATLKQGQKQAVHPAQ
jgi:hypothetical protein